MRIFVAGATGSIGVALLPLLRRAGHQVTGLTRAKAKGELIRQLGAEPAYGDALDEAAIQKAMNIARPDVVVHQLTALAGMSDMRRFAHTFAATNELRTKGLDILLRAATQVGARRLVAQSFCGWPYARDGDKIKSEEAPLDPNPPPELQSTLNAIKYLEKNVLNATSMEGLVLRYGAFYGDRTGMCDGAIVELLRRRRLPLIGSGEGWWSFVHIEDAAQATAIAAESGLPGIYNICDDEPAPVREWLPALGRMVGAKAPRYIPAWVARLAAGRHTVVMMTECRAGSNAKAKRELQWHPAHTSWRQGFADVLANQSMNKFLIASDIG